MALYKYDRDQEQSQQVILDPTMASYTETHHSCIQATSWSNSHNIWCLEDDAAQHFFFSNLQKTLEGKLNYLSHNKCLNSMFRKMKLCGLFAWQCRKAACARHRSQGVRFRAPAWHTFLGQGCIPTHHNSNSAMALFVSSCKLWTAACMLLNKNLKAETNRFQIVTIHVLDCYS